MEVVRFSFDPAVIVLILLGTGLYVRAVRVLGGRGYRVPVGQQVAWHSGMALTALGLLSPIDTLGDDLLSAHMAEHLLIADLAAPFFLIGIRSPVYAFILPRPLLVTVARRHGLRRFFRFIRRPVVAVPIWIVILYGWHFAFLFDAALRHPLLHALQHEFFVAGSVLVWWSVIDPKRRRLPGELWKVPYILGARLPGMLLGMAFIVMSSPAYAAYYGERARDHGLSPLTDQQIAGGMMMALDLFVMLFCLGFFFYRSAQDHDRAHQAATATG
jgi:cytochrome c oxidase assembly factor CtaG